MVLSELEPKLFKGELYRVGVIMGDTRSLGYGSYRGSLFRV